MKDTFAQAQQRIRRMLEDVGGSADAYDEVIADKVIDTPEAPKKPSWEEVVGGKVTTVRPASSDSREDSYKLQLNIPISEEDLAQTRREFGIGDGCATEPDIEDFYLGRNIDPKLYQHVGPTCELGELETIYQALLASSKGVNTETVILDSGTYEIEKQLQGRWGITDTVKGLGYSWCSPHIWYPNAVEPGDHFIWIVRMSDDKNLGYVHNGDVFMSRIVA